uniref:Peptidase aspartic putative domain-containing protein n=1 Tax=Parascaris univalens TaxID=6257 RepID=A0A914ZZ38_PARUN
MNVVLYPLENFVLLPLRRKNCVSCVTDMAFESVLISISTTTATFPNSQQTTLREQALSRCLEVEVVNPLDKKIHKTVLAMLDSGNRRSYLEENVAQQLGDVIIGSQPRRSRRDLSQCFIRIGYSEDALRQFWDLELLGVRDQKLKGDDDLLAVPHSERITCIDPHKRINVPSHEELYLVLSAVNFFLQLPSGFSDHERELRLSTNL